MKKFIHPIHSRRILIVTLFAFLLAYVLLRAYNLSFTHDESLSYAIVNDYSEYVETANNHFLNTLLMSWCNSIFGSSEFSLRLPNVLAFLLYLTGCFYLLKTTKYKLFLFFGFSMLLLNPFLLEFFSLARGYGISLAFMLISILFILRNGNYYTDASTLIKDLLFASLFASLALYANLGMINFYISLLLIFILKYIFFRRKLRKRIGFDFQFIGALMISIVPISIATKQLLRLKADNQLYFGEHSILKGAHSLINSSIYTSENNLLLITLIEVVIALILLMGVIYIVIKKKYDGPLFIISLLILFISGGLFLEHHLFGAKYPAFRTALFFIPILALFMYHLLLDAEVNYPMKKKYLRWFIICLTLPLCINFIAGSNFTQTKSWRFDAHTKDAMVLIRDHTLNIDSNISISNNWLFEPTINYYISTWKLKIKPANREMINASSDFIYRLEDTTTLINYKVLCSYDDIQSSLLMKIEK